MKLTDRLIASPQVVARVVGEETLILDLATGTYFGLSPVGARIWQLLESGKTLGEACEALLEEYDVTRDLLEADGLALAGELIDNNLATVD